MNGANFEPRSSPGKPPVTPTVFPRSRRAHLLTCMAINQLAFPGLGTIMAGRRIGYVQAAIMVTGFILFVGFFLKLLATIFQYIRTGDELGYRAHLGDGLWAAILGFALCALAWCWALASSLQLWRELPKSPRR